MPLETQRLEEWHDLGFLAQVDQVHIASIR